MIEITTTYGRAVVEDRWVPDYDGWEYSEGRTLFYSEDGLLLNETPWERTGIRRKMDD